MDYKQAFLEEYLRGQRIFDYSQDCGVDHDNITLLDETPEAWIMKVSADHGNQWLNVVWKRKPEGYIPSRMAVIEL
jgi:hypothetical protein